MDNQWKYAGVAGASILLTLAAASVAGAATDGGLGRFARADANGDGVVTRVEWLQATATRFARLDRNGDGKLDASELPRHGHRGHRGAFDRGMHSGYDDGAPPPAPAGTPTH